MKTRSRSSPANCRLHRIFVEPSLETYVKLLLAVRSIFFPTTESCERHPMMSSRREKVKNPWNPKMEPKTKPNPTELCFDPETTRKQIYIKQSMVQMMPRVQSQLFESARADPHGPETSDSLRFFIRTPNQAIFELFSSNFSIRTQLWYS